MGPSPPVVKMMSERLSPLVKASASISRLSPTWETHCSCMPSGGNREAMKEALVSVSSPIKSSVPMDIISAFIELPPRCGAPLKNVRSKEYIVWGL